MDGASFSLDRALAPDLLLQIDVAPTGARLRRRFALSSPPAAVFAFVRAAVARGALESGALDGAAAKLARPGGIALVTGFPPFSPLPRDAASLSAAGLQRRDKLIARAAE
jgi:hypothetical protein